MNEQVNDRNGVRLTHHSLRVWGEALALVSLTKAAGIRDAVVRDHAPRAPVSVALNVAEGAGRVGKTRLQHFSFARGSVVELVAAFEIAEALGEKVPVAEVRERGAAVSRMLAGLLRR